MRIKVRIFKATADHVQLALFVNGGLASGQCGLALRVSEVVEFLLRLNPDRVEVDLENVTDDLRSRLQGFTAVTFV